MIKLICLTVLLSVISASKTRYYGGGDVIFGYFMQPSYQSTDRNTVLFLLNRLPLNLYNNYICNILVGAMYQNNYYYPLALYPYSYLYTYNYDNIVRNKRATSANISIYQMMRYSQVVRRTISSLYPFWDVNDLSGLYDQARAAANYLILERRRTINVTETIKELLRLLIKNSHESRTVQEVMDAIQQLNSKPRSFITSSIASFVKQTCRVIKSEFYCNYLNKLTYSNRCSSMYHSSQIWNQCCSGVYVNSTTTTTSTPTTSSSATSATTTVPTTTASTTIVPTTTTTGSTTRSCGISVINPARRFSDFYIAISKVRIVGGVPAEKCEYPWVVRLQAADSLCAGSIIDETHILTAAHCVGASTKNIDVTVYAGDHNYNIVDTGEVTRGVSSITIHPNYGVSSVQNDIAVLTLDQPLVYSDCIQPICLPKAGDSSSLSNTQCTVAGWGTTSFGGPSAPILQEVTVPTYNGNDCKNIFPASVINNPTTQICAGRDGADSCQGDSGGPLFCPVNGNYVQYGIVSFGEGCAEPGSGGVYTDVSSMLSFINSVQ
ncbi:coagulation factor X-like [Patella vulgata]|uniref:coagulation factor X-like n=1 Tax=Patella vulgata TaxID=6465 RepID=UPI0024A870D0|nr:coagulation factor X-like [Patella vulgata]